MHGILISLYLAFSPFRQTYIFGHCHHSRFSRIRILNCYHITSQVISCHIIKTIADGEGQQSQVISFRIVPHHVSSHHILLYRVTYCHILSHHVTHCHIKWQFVTTSRQSPMEEDNRAKQPPGSSLSVHVQHPKNLGRAMSSWSSISSMSTRPSALGMSDPIWGPLIHIFVDEKKKCKG